MNRRAFLQLAGAGAVGLLIGGDDPERALWTPGQKTIFLPPAPKPVTTIETAGWGSDTLTRGDIITIGGVFARNPITGRATPHLQQFIVTADVAAGKPLQIEQLHPHRAIPRDRGRLRANPLFVGTTIGGNA